MHQGERMALAIWIPLSVLVAVSDGLHQWLGAWGFLLALPTAFLLLNVLPYALGGSGPASQWWRWLGVGVLWAVFRLDAGGVTGVFAWGWMVLFAANVLALALHGLQRTFGIGGRTGIAWRWMVLLGAHGILIVAAWLWGWPWLIAGGALLAALICWTILNPRSQWLGKVTDRVTGGNILITIDDGPDPKDTPVLLDLLDRYETKALFFMIGDKVAAYPELAREVLRRGHEIGNHTMSHPQASFWCAGPSRTWREMEECQRVIQETTGVKPRWFRAPVGHRNWFTHPIAGRFGLQVMAWNRRGYDAVEKDAGKVLGRILPGLGAGDIVLLHESTPIAAEVLEGVLSKLSTRCGDGCRFC